MVSMSKMQILALAGADLLRSAHIDNPVQDMPVAVVAPSQLASLEQELRAARAALAAEEKEVAKLGAVLAYLGVAEPAGDDPVYLAGHAPALQVFQTGDTDGWRVRLEGANTPLANSLEVSTLGTDLCTPGAEVRAQMVYASSSRPTRVELVMPYFFLPGDQRTMQVLRQGRVVKECTVPTLHPGGCFFEFGAEHKGQRFTVKALETASGRVLQRERLYVPLPTMCASSPFSRNDIDEMDCRSLPSSPSDFQRTVPLPVDDSATARGFAVEVEFMARDASQTEGVFGPEALEQIRGCMAKKVQGTVFGDNDFPRWNWEEEPSMLPFTKAESPDPKEYGGPMAELTSPGPGPNSETVLLGQKGLADAMHIFDNLRHMGIQVSLWAQLHVHVNALSTKAGGSCCLNTDQIVNLWTHWAIFQPVIDEMQLPTNVNNKWAMPLYLEDPIVRQVFARMHAAYGTDLPASEACEAFYGAGLCDGGEGHGYRPETLPSDSSPFVHSPARYYALNLAPLTGKGTIEIRQNAGTNDAERAQRWIQFVLAFVETFKDQRADFMPAADFRPTVAEAVEGLKAAQERASFRSLFGALEARQEQLDTDLVSADSEAYFAELRWAKQDGSFKPNCAVRA